MEIRDKIVVVTGAASGIGAGLVRRFAAEGAKAVVASDMNEEGLAAVAQEAGAAAITANVAKEADVLALVERTEDEIGPIDLFCSNAGIIRRGGLEAPNDEWQLNWDIHVMAHVYAARALVPRMAARGGGYFLHTASAAGLLNQIGSATYGVTKHAAVGFAEWLSIEHGHEGIKVSVLCPQAVRTAMTAGGTGAAGVDGMLEVDQLCDTVMETLAEERFLCLPHPTVLEYMQRKTSDYDRWLGGMRRLKERVEND